MTALIPLLGIGALLWWFFGGTASAEAATGSTRSTSGLWAEDIKNLRIRDAIAKWAGIHKLDPRLLAAIAYVESNYDPLARNPADPSYGLLQVTPLIGKAYAGTTTPEELYDLDKNLQAGGGFIKHLLSRYGNLENAIQAYNIGETKFDKGTRSPAYVEKVMKKYAAFGGGRN